MGINLTGAFYKALQFGDVNSRDYGVYITGAGIYDAPVRSVEEVTIPGRNGAFIIDNGRFENIEITYPASIVGKNEEEFAAGIQAFRNALASQIGYQRLTDGYNPDEYRQAVFTAGIAVTPAQLRAGEFEITFNAKPQRFLTSGEETVSVTDGDTLTNPTLFDAAPLLMVDGYGTITINGERITIYDEPIGVLTTPNAAIRGDTFSYPVGILDAANNGDPITVTDAHIAFTAKSNMDPGPSIVGVSAEQTSGDITVSTTGMVTGNYEVRLRCYFGSVQFVKGTAKTETMVVAVTVAFSSSAPVTGNVTITYAYDGNKTVTVSFTPLSGFTEKNPEVGTGVISVNSSKGSLGNPLYFDLDIGEAYKYEGGIIVSVNNAVSFGAVLPALPPGNTIITYDSTVFSLEIVPRWWQI